MTSERKAELWEAINRYSVDVFGRTDAVAEVGRVIAAIEEDARKEGQGERIWHFAQCRCGSSRDAVLPTAPRPYCPDCGGRR